MSAPVCLLVVAVVAAADKDHFAELAVTAIMRLKGTGNLESIHLIKKPGGALKVSCLLRPSLLRWSAYK